MVHSYEGIQGRNPPRLCDVKPGAITGHFSNKIQVVLIE